MCGISGIISKKDLVVTKGDIKRITDPVIHRGPDNEGYYFGSNFALGHRRLSIIDLSESANLPMIYKDKYTITYNGEIYNYIEIRKHLVSKGYVFRTDSDTEVILAAYDHYGTDCITHFNGMWAFAIYDSEREIIFCSRDRFGVKPFYYTDTGDKFVFGSEIKQILAISQHNTVNLPILADYLIASLDDHSNQTFFSGIQKLQQSHNLLYDLRSHSYKISRYYEIRIKPDLKLMNEQESVKCYSELLTDSVRLRLRSDVKVGACLSGGLDSSSIVSIASALNSNKYPLASVTAGSTEHRFDETAYAMMVSNHLSLDMHIFTPQPSDFESEVSKIIRVQEEPFGSPSICMQYMVFRKAREIGCTVMLDGQGGDETLLGYERYFPAYIMTPGKRNFFGRLKESSVNSGISQMKLLMYYLYFTQPMIHYGRMKYRLGFLKKSFFSLLNRHILYEGCTRYKDITALQKHEIENVQLPHLLKYEDKNSMIHSIESRLPYLDYRLVEAALSLNDNFKIRDGWTKYLLRKSVESRLPSEITWRKNKIGFNAPEATWIDRISNQMKEQIMRSEILGNVSDNDKIISKFDNLDLRLKWRLYNISKWEEEFNVGSR